VDIGQGYSGSIVVSNRLYTQAQDTSGQYVYCLNLMDGSTIWKTRYNFPWLIDGEWPGPYATPVYADGRIYYADCYQKIGCLDAETGKAIWSVNLAETYQGKGTEFGYACSPTVLNGRVYAPVGGENASIVAFDAVSGKEVWASGNDRASYTACLPIRHRGKDLLVTFMQNAILAHDASTGKQLWRHPWLEGYDEHAAWPIYKEPYLYFAGPFRQGCKVFNLDDVLQNTLSDPVWAGKVLSNDIFSSVEVDGFLYGFDIHDMQASPSGETGGAFKCVRMDNGEEQWSTTNVPHCSVIVRENQLILYSEHGELIIAKATPRQYEELARHALFTNELCWTVPALSEYRLIVRGKKTFKCYYLGPDSDDPPRGEVIIRSRPQAWYEAWRSPAFYAPGWGDFLAWFMGSILLVFTPATILAAVFNSQARLSRFLWCSTMILSGAIGPACYSTAAGRFLFTWPAAVFASCLMCIGVIAWARQNGHKNAAMHARLALAGIVISSAFYGIMCMQRFLPAGIGFLAGLLVSLPFMYPVARRFYTDSFTLRLGGLLLLTYSLYFWSSAWVIIIRTT
jgi:outer membrane protein assembly factor BamB